MNPTGAVLAGGRSTRMGRDKAMLQLGGEPMVRRAARTLRDASLTPVFVVGGDRDALTALDLVHVEDRWPGEGPLGGILTALDHAGGRDVVVLACDTPLVSSDTVARLVQAPDDAAVVVASDGDRFHPLVGRYSTRCAAALRERFDAGVRAMHAALDGLDVVTIEIESRELQNVNRPADVESVARILERT